MLVHGHVLLYPAANADRPWWNDSAFDGKREDLIRRYIREIGGARPGGVQVWDVVNEVFGDPYHFEQGITDARGLRTDYVEYSEIGPDYVEQAFGWAEEVVDDDVALIINDYGAETRNIKSDALFDYVLYLRDERGVDIDGVGFQMHVSSAEMTDASRAEFIADVESNFARFANAGFDLYITELDVQATVTSNPNFVPTQAQVQAQADLYRAITELALRTPRMQALLMWDFSDDRSWLHPTDRPLGENLPIGSYTFATPWAGGGGTDDLTPKPAYFAMRDALSAANPPPLTVFDLPSPGSGDRIVRFQNEWGPAGYLTRFGASNGQGGFDATTDTRLYELDGRSDSWSSMWWTIEPAEEPGYFRIRNRWQDNNGYLGRDGVFNGIEWIPQTGLHLDALDPAGWHQQWSLEPTGTGSFALVNRWGAESGVLTRSGVERSPGVWDPIDDVFLATPETWSSQHWVLHDN